jgi:hypothetical protein
VIQGGSRDLSPTSHQGKLAKAGFPGKKPTEQNPRCSTKHVEERRKLKLKKMKKMKK